LLSPNEESFPATGLDTETVYASKTPTSVRVLPMSDFQRSRRVNIQFHDCQQRICFLIEIFLDSVTKVAGRSFAENKGIVSTRRGGTGQPSGRNFNVMKSHPAYFTTKSLIRMNYIFPIELDGGKESASIVQLSPWNGEN